MATRPTPAPIRRPVAARPRQAVRQSVPRSHYGPELPPDHDGLWKWVAWAALAHLVVLVILLVVGWFKPSPPPQPQWINLMPSGSLTHGSPNGKGSTSSSTKTTAQPSPHPVQPPHHHSAETEPDEPVIHAHTPTPQPRHEVTTPAPVATEKPQKPHHHRVETEAPTHAPTITDHPSIVHHSTPPPTPPPVKTPLVDLHEVTRVVPATEPAEHPTATHTETPKPTVHHHHTTPSPHPHENSPDDSPPETTQDGPSQAEIARQLEEKLQAAGVSQATATGPSGSANGHSSDYGPFYDMIRDQIMDNMPSTYNHNLNQPIVQIHVNPDGRVPRDMVVLIRSSGDTAYDKAALDAARNLGQLQQSLPPGCPPDINVRFEPTR